MQQSIWLVAFFSYLGWGRMVSPSRSSKDFPRDPVCRGRAGYLATLPRTILRGPRGKRPSPVNALSSRDAVPGEASSRPRGGSRNPPQDPTPTSLSPGGPGGCRVILGTAFLLPSPCPSCSGAGREGSGFLPLPSPGAGQQLLRDQLGTKATRSSPGPPLLQEERGLIYSQVKGIRTRLW